MRSKGGVTEQLAIDHALAWEPTRRYMWAVVTIKRDLAAYINIILLRASHE